MQKYRFEDPDEVMFTADHHFGHENIIKYCGRPYNDVHYMNEDMIWKWNNAVREDQTVFHLGDFSFRNKMQVQNILARLNGNVILIRGNHDHKSTFGYFHNVHDIAEVVVGPKGADQRIILCHYAMRVWNHSFRGAWHLYGHSHGTLPPRQDHKELDIGVDCWDFMPVPYWMIEDTLQHHGEETTNELPKVSTVPHM